MDAPEGFDALPDWVKAVYGDGKHDVSSGEIAKGMLDSIDAERCANLTVDVLELLADEPFEYQLCAIAYYISRHENPDLAEVTAAVLGSLIINAAEPPREEH